MIRSLILRSARSAVIALAALGLVAVAPLTAWAATYFSQGSVSPNTLANWNTVRAGGGSAPANFTTAGDVFVIQSPHNMTTTVAWTVTGGTTSKIQIESGGTLTANNLVAVPVFQVDNGGTYVHNAVSGATNGSAADVPGSTSRSFGATSTVEFQKWANGGTSPVALPSPVTWGNLKINVTLLAGSWSQLGTLTSVAGNLTIQATGGTTREFRLNANSPATSTLTVSGDVIVTGGIFNITSGTAVETFNTAGNLTLNGGTLTATGAGPHTVNFTGGAASVAATYSSGTLTGTNLNWTIASGKTLAVSGAFAPLVASGRSMTVNGAFQLDPTASLGATGTWTYGAGASLNLNETAGRTIDGTSQFWPGASGPTNVNVSGAGTVTMNATRTVPGNLTFTNGAMSLGADLTVNGVLGLGAQKLTTGAGPRVILPATGSLTRSTGYVVGNLQKNVATGANVARTFEIGDAGSYTPASISFASVTGAGDIVGSTAVPGSVPAPALLNATRFVNRSWTLANTGVAFTSYDATLNFAAGDIQGGGDPTRFFVAKNSAGSYTRPAIATRTATSTQATGMTDLSDFYVGETSFNVEASAGPDGSISPSGTVSVPGATDQAFTITPNTNHHVAGVLVDAVGIGTPTSYTFTNVSANHSIDASFAIDTYSITASAGANGSISPSGATVVNAAASQAYTITPNPGYIVQDVLVDAVSVGAVPSYTFTNVLANHTISASFAPDPSSTVSAGSPGTFVTTVASAAVPITLSRGVTTPVLGFSIKFTLSGLTTTTSAVTEGGFLSASGSTTNFHVTDNGGGTYTVDAVTLGLPCGSTATSGTLFTVNVGSAQLGGTGTLTLNSVTLRDCSNATLASSVGTAATVSVDRSTPVVAVTSPNGAESWLQGSVHAITWTATDAEGIAANSITLEYSVDNGANWLPVAGGLANSGSFNWTVPNNPSATALVRASALDVHSNPGSDASDAVFTLQATTTTSLASAPNPSLAGESVALTATVAPAGATGSIEFFDGATSLGTAPLSGGTASLNTSALPVGVRSLTAVYAGSPLHAGSTSSALSHTVNPAATTTSLTSAPNPSLAGQSVALTATVTVTPPGAGSPGGSVEFFDGASSLGSGPVSAGAAVLNTSSLGTGPHSLTAVYSGDGSFTGSTSAAHSHVVDPASTTTTLASAPNPSLAGESVVLTAGVAVDPPGSGTATGSVEFFDGATSLGTAPLSGGSASLNTATLAVGSHSLTAVYAGSSSFTGSTSAVHAHSVNQAATTTTVVSAANPSVAGESVAITASVAVVPPGAGTAGGSVELFDGATSLGSVALSGGSAVLNTSSLAVGPHSLTAVYAGSTSLTGSTSAVHTHTVNPAGTSTSLTSAPNPSLFGQSTTLTASVTVTPPGAGGPGGSVEFFDGATSLGTSPVVAGTASLATSSLAVGPHSLTAVYSGDASFSGSTSPAHAHSVGNAPTTTSLTSSPNPSVTGESVALTATVSPSAATGSVEFFDGASSLGTASLTAGTATLNTSSLAAGSHSLTAVYGGDLTYTGSTSAAHGHTVNPASTTTSVTSTPNPSVTGESVAISATVAPVPPGASVPAGSVEFFDGATSLGTVPLVAGAASLNTSSLTVGPHSLTALYGGSASFSGSTSSAHAHTVSQAATATALTSTPNPSLFEQAVALNATVAPVPPGAGGPGGSVEFFDGATSLGTVPLVAGAASLNTSSLSVGPHSLTAVYSGDASFTGSTSAVHSHTVSQAASSTSVASSLNPSTFGASVMFTATVAPSGATGSIEFFNGATSLGTSPVVAGSAALSTSTLAAGSHPITAVYSGDTNYSGSTSSVLTQVVNAAGTSVTLVASPNPGVSLDPETLTATVAPSGATGSIEFFDGATSLGTSPLSAGSAQLITSSLSVGLHSLTAVYPGDSNHSGATSSAVSLEIRAKIVATAGANGSITPSGTVLVSLGATPSFAFAADPGYHVASVTVDGAGAPLTSPYTFAPVSSNHTIDVQFAVNPAVAAITTLASVQQRTGNDGDGTTKITLTWTPVPAGSTVEVWRKGYGNYPEYNSGASPGSVPATPAAYPPAGWTLTAVTLPGDTDEPASRDFWYYVAYVRDGFGTHSPVSNRPAGALNYHLGDVSDGTTVGAGDNRVTTTDVSVLGLHYGLTGAAAAPYNFLDVGPTTDLSVTARPMTDGRINFEDLVMFAINYFPVASTPQSRARPAAASADVVTLSAPIHAAAGEDIVVHVLFSGTGQMQALSTRLAWDPAVVEPVSCSAGDAVLEQGGLVFSPEPGTADGASFAGNGQGLVGEGEFASLHFRVVAAGDPRFGFAKVDARDHQNHKLQISSGVLAVTPKTFVTAFAPAVPNPFSRTTAFQFSLGKPGRAELELFSVDGRRVRTLSSGVREAGDYRLEWNGTDDSGRPLAAGVYYARLLTAQGRFTRVVTFLK